MTKPALNEQFYINTMYCIEGLPCEKAADVYRVAAARGYVGSEATIYRRLKAGANTWAELTAPVRRTGLAARAETAKRKKQEGEAIAAAIDARKKELGL